MTPKMKKILAKKSNKGEPQVPNKAITFWGTVTIIGKRATSENDRTQVSCLGLWLQLVRRLTKQKKSLTLLPRKRPQS